MPLGKYFHGHGEEVAREMKKKHGKNWKKYFYGRANKLGLTGGGKFSDEDMKKGYKVVK